MQAFFLERADHALDHAVLLGAVVSNELLLLLNSLQLKNKLANLEPGIPLLIDMSAEGRFQSI